MLFGYNLIDKSKDEHLREIALIARDSKTLIFIDTNILAYLYKLHSAARQEFFRWTDSVLSASRLQIPAWSANEYLTKVTKRELHSYTPRNKNSDQSKVSLETMLETAKLFVDEAVLLAIGFPRDRTAFFAEFKSAIDALPQFTRAFSHQFDPEAVHDEIQSKLQLAIIKSDLAALCVRAAQEGNVRFEHRLPPGFRDGDKPENKLGDLIIWFEILQCSKERRESFDKVLFITNDEKSDWVYAPQRRKEIVRGVRKSVPNDKSGIKVVDPRLVSEFKGVTGYASITICSLGALIEGLSKESAPDFEQLAAAIQINLGDDAVIATPDSTPLETTTEEHSAEAVVDEVAVDSVVEQAAPVAEAVAPAAVAVGGGADVAPLMPTLSYAPEALRDSDYQYDAPSAINEIIRALKSHNWYTQNPAINQISVIANEEFPPSAWFVLGRNIYQTACGNSQKAMDFIANLNSRLAALPIENGRHVLAGMLFEIYFDSLGEFRNTLKTRFIDIPMQQVAADQYSDVREFILHQLHEYQGALSYLPGDISPRTLLITSAPILAEGPLNIDGRQHELLSVQLDGVELVQDYENPFPGFNATYTIDSMVQQISHVLAIPRWTIRRIHEPAVRPDAEFFLPENRTLNAMAALPTPVP